MFLNFESNRQAARQRLSRDEELTVVTISVKHTQPSAAPVLQLQLDQ